MILHLTLGHIDIAVRYSSITSIERNGNRVTVNYLNTNAELDYASDAVAQVRFKELLSQWKSALMEEASKK